MTTVLPVPDTASPALASMVRSGQRAVAGVPSEAVSRDATAPLSGTAPATSATVAGSGRGAVADADLAYVAAALADAAEYQECHLGQPVVAAAYRRIARSLGDRAVPPSRPGSATVATAGGIGDEHVTGAALQLASRADRARLIAWLWATCPEVVEAGVRALAGAAVINADKARRRRNRRATLRYRRRHRMPV
jgi:hypothetical protein